MVIADVGTICTALPPASASPQVGVVVGGCVTSFVLSAEKQMLVVRWSDMEEGSGPESLSECFLHIAVHEISYTPPPLLCLTMGADMQISFLLTLLLRPTHYLHGAQSAGLLMLI